MIPDKKRKHHGIMLLADQLVKIKHDFQNYSFITSSYLEHALNRQQNYQLGNGLIHSKLRCTVGLMVVDIAYQ